MSALQTLLRTRIHGHASNKGWISLNCPMCVLNGQSRNDTRSRGGVLFSADGSVGYQCFNCNFKTGWMPGWTLGFRMRKLMRQLGFDEAEIQRLALELLSQADLEQLAQREPEIQWQPNWPSFDPGFELRPVEDARKLEYLEKRQLRDLAVWLETDYEYLGMNRRVILPYTYENKLVGYLGRYAGDVPEKVSKYIRKAPADYVYGIDRQQPNREFVIVSEGEFDALFTGGVSVGGNNLSDNQVQLIESLNIEPIVIPDKDAPGRKLAERAADVGWSVSFPEWEDCKDVSDAVMKYGRLFAVYSILQAAEHSPTKIRLMMRKYCQ
jgi:DNA primase